MAPREKVPELPKGARGVRENRANSDFRQRDPRFSQTVPKIDLAGSGKMQRKMSDGTRSRRLRRGRADFIMQEHDDYGRGSLEAGLQRPARSIDGTYGKASRPKW
jgi:hypothetical protein